MASIYKTPGVYIEEITKFPPSIAEVETAIPVFIGYTQIVDHLTKGNLKEKPQRITSLLEYEAMFGGAQPEPTISVEVNENAQTGEDEVKVSVDKPSKFRMFYSLQFYFANGGGPCYIITVGNYDNDTVDFTELMGGLAASDRKDEITLILFPDAQELSMVDYYSLYKEAVDRCVELKDRFVIMDVYDADNTKNSAEEPVANFRTIFSGTVNDLKYAAAYYPNVETILDYQYDPAKVSVKIGKETKALSDLLADKQNASYFRIKSAIRDKPIVMPPSAGMAGIYANVDATRGVWKAPANVNMDYVIRPTQIITDKEQRDLNVDVEGGKSINVIRFFTGRGPAIVWGARTLAGNDNEWRYISVRRFCNMVEESVQNACGQFVFEPNDTNTWVRVRAMIENFLILQWRAGALQGSKPDQAFYVAVGLNQTMTALDVLEGRMIVEIGMAIVRPAEFIILRFSQLMPQA